MTNFSEAVAKKRKALADQAQRQAELARTVKATSDGAFEVTRTLVKQGAKSRLSTQKVEVQNDNLAKTDDVQGVVDSINKLNVTTFLASKDSWSQIVNDMAVAAERIQAVVDGLNGNGQQIDQLLTSAVSGLSSAVESIKSVKIENDKGLVAEIKKLNKSIDAIEVNPVVNVAAPKVSVDAPVVDLSGVERAIEGIKQTPEQAFSLKDYIAQDMDNTNPGFQYVGMVDPTGRWCIVENDIQENTLRYALGEQDYGQAWGDHIQLIYRIISEAVDAVSA